MDKKIISNLRNSFFGTIDTKEKAVKVIKDAAYALYFLVGLQIVLSMISKVALVDVIIILFILGFVLKKKKSRIVAIMAFFLATTIVVIMILNFIGVTAIGRKNIFLAIIFFLASLRAVQATFKYHKIIKSKIIVKNIIILCLIASLYSIIIAFIVGIIYAATLSDIENANETILGGIIILLAAIVFLMTFLRLLPFTKNKPIVIIENEENRSQSKGAV